jgi:hypothetical protein
MCWHGGCVPQVASFERNPLACLPNYRNKLMQLLPRLQMLDGQGISGQDRQRAGAALKQEAACMAVMLSNACMVHKLVSCFFLCSNLSPCAAG